MPDKTEPRKMAFYEIGRNNQYSQWMQEEFEKAQQYAMKNNQKVTITSKITVYPPNLQEENSVCEIEFDVSSKIPSRKSIKHSCEIKDNYIVANVTAVQGHIQEELNLQMPDITTKEKRKVI